MPFGGLERIVRISKALTDLARTSMGVGIDVTKEKIGMNNLSSQDSKIQEPVKKRVVKKKK